VEATRSTINLHVLKEQQKKAEVTRLEQLKEQIENDLRNNAKFAQFSSQVKLDMTKDGLRIQIVDEHQRPMFDVGSAHVKPHMRDLLRAIGGILVEVPNRLTLEGHTDATPFGSNDRSYSNWELSSDRANASRRELMAGGLAEDRVLRVQGMAASSPFIADDPLDPQNRRISIIVMNREAEDRFFRPQLDSVATPVAEGASQAEPSIRPQRPMLVSSQPIVGR
jgi:chemotaxis protein MotB